MGEIYKKIATGFIFIFFALITPHLANATIYQPGETLEPDCAPGSPTCGVGIFSINGETNSSQTLVVGNSGIDFNIVSGLGVHTFNIPDASAGARGLLTSSDWGIFNNKQANLGFTPLNRANNLSDVASAVISRTNLGLGTLATQNGTFSGSSTGTNTGDQTNVTGNAGTATALQTARNINGTSFNGTADITITAAAGTLTGNTLNSGVTASSLTSLGTLSSLSLSGAITGATSYNGLAITANTGVVTTGTWSATTIAVSKGGTGTTNGSITGTGALSFTSASFNALTIDSGTTGAVNIGTGTGGTGKTISIGNTNGTTLLNFNAGSGGIFLTGAAPAAAGNVSLCIDVNNQIFFGATDATCNPSSARYKHDIADISLGLDAVNALRPVSYVYNSNNEANLGFIAEEAAQVDERLVKRDASGMIQAINPNAFTPILTHAVQQLSGMVDDLSSKVKKVMSGYFDEIFSNKSHQKILCVGDVDNGGETCITKSQLDQLLQNQNNLAPAPTETPKNNVGPTSDDTSPIKEDEVLPKDIQASAPPVSTPNETPTGPELTSQ